MKKIKFCLHGLVYSFFAPIAVYVSDSGDVIISSPHSIWRMVLFCILLCLLVGLISFLVFREHSSAGLVSLLFVLAVFYTGPYFLLLLSSIILYWILLGVTLKKIDFETHPHISALMISVVVSIYFGIKYVGLVTNADWDETKSMAQSLEASGSRQVEGGNSPDIYYIVLDGYGGTEMIKKLHGYDNIQFILDLEKRGFVVPSESKPNYARTLFSLTSTLNMQYLETVSKKMGSSNLWWPLMGTITHNETRKLLESLGYKTVTVASGFDFTTYKDADVYIQLYPIFLNEFEETYILQTNLSRLKFLNRLGVSFPSYDTHRQIILNNFEQLQEIPKIASPKFVFVHILAPHAPFVFDGQGGAVTPAYEFSLIDGRNSFSLPAVYHKGYVDTLKFLNVKILEAVDEIIKKSATPPIIILQGDHGSGLYIDYHSAADTCMYERFSILNAYYLPDIKGRPVIPEDITPVNTFRIIFNQYFGAGFEILPNRYYFSTNSAMYQFEDIQDRMDIPCLSAEGEKH